MSGAIIVLQGLKTVVRYGTYASQLTNLAKGYVRCYRCDQIVGTKGRLVERLCTPCIRDRAQGETEGFYRHKARLVRKCRSCGTSNISKLQLLRRRIALTEMCRDCTKKGYTGKRGRDGFPGDEIYRACESPIERALLLAMEQAALPIPDSQVNVLAASGEILTRIDFAYPHARIAIYADGITYHGNEAAMMRDQKIRNELSTRGWLVLAFTGKAIRDTPMDCVKAIERGIAARTAPSTNLAA